VHLYDELGEAKRVEWAGRGPIVHTGKKDRLIQTVVVGIVVACAALPARAGLFEPDVYGNGMSLDQYMRPVFGGGQPGGPAYTFLMGKYEITNAQYAAFLNDAQLDGGATGKGSNMVFESSGRVRTVGDQFTMFAPAIAFSGIHYDPGLPIGQRYFVLSNTPQLDHSPFPANRMSLLGAMKFCNWLTLDQGLGESERVYHEGPNYTDWHSMSISTANFQSRDLNPIERQDMVDNYLGYRLPMDNQAVTASAYNEYYKAAAWDTTTLVNHTYGFGRDTIDVGDANGNINSGGPDDPFETDQDLQTTPVGFYDGTNWQRSQWNWPLPMDTFQTRVNLNSYGIYDLSGNVNDWMQDRFQPASINHVTRGGSFLRPASQVTVTYREGFLPMEFTTELGMRVVRIPEPATLSILIVLFGLVSGRQRRQSRFAR
jgi:formylglycine-generating enzyme required for sulfatase activity